MKKIKKSLLAASILVGTCVAPMAAIQSLGQERPASTQRIACQCHMLVAAVLVHNHHARVHSLLTQAMHQPQGGDGRPAQLVAAINQYNSHLKAKD